MTDYDYKATIETEHGTFTMEGDRARTVSAQAARMPVLLHQKQIENRIDLDVDIWEYMEKLAQQEKELKRKSQSPRSERNRRD